MARARWIMVLALVAAAGFAYGETISVTTFGHGSTRSEAITSGKSQAVKDAFGSSLSLHEPAARASLANPSGQIGRTRIVGVTKLGPGSYEAEIEVDVEVSTPVPVEFRKRVALVSELNQTESVISNELLEAIRDRLSSSNQLTLIERQDPAIASAMERVKAAKVRGAADLVRAGKAPRVDLLCVVATESLKHSTAISAIERHEMKARISFIDVATTETKKVRTVKSVRSGVPAEASVAIMRDTSNQIATAIVDFIAPPGDGENSAKVITVPTGSVRLGIGQPVNIYKVTKASSSSVTREVAVTTGEVISIGPSYARVIAEDYLVKTDHHIVKPIVNARPRGVVSDSDW